MRAGTEWAPCRAEHLQGRTKPFLLVAPPRSRMAFLLARTPPPHVQRAAIATSNRPLEREARVQGPFAGDSLPRTPPPALVLKDDCFRRQAVPGRVGCSRRLMIILPFRS